MTEATCAALRRNILRWYAARGRTLPWRGERDPYRILVAEVMLQQTQVSRVLQKYPLFLKRFPTLSALAGASKADVVRAWQGMGYNNRAVRLHALAHTVAESHAGLLPCTEEALRRLPGIGRYTARALLSSAFGVPVPVVDVNVHRALSRIGWRMERVSSMRPVASIETLATQLLPRSRAYDWNQAMMDLGATVCKARAPRCDVCPVANQCRSRSHMLRQSSRRNVAEPSLDGVPVRIYRGKLIERLRRLDQSRSMRLETLGRAILPAFSPRQTRWLGGVVAGLERDGLVNVERVGSMNRWRVRLA